MDYRTRLVVGSCCAFLACGIDLAHAAPEVARSADVLVDTIGVNVHGNPLYVTPSHPDNAYFQWDSVIRVIGDIGFRVVRDLPTPVDKLNQLSQQTGVKVSAIIQGPGYGLGVLDLATLPHALGDVEPGRELLLEQKMAPVPVPFGRPSSIRPMTAKTCSHRDNPAKWRDILPGRVRAAGRVWVIVALFVWAGCNAKPAQPNPALQTDNVPATMQSSADEEIRQGLLKCTVKPYYTAWPQRNRVRYFDRMKQLGSFDIAKRDQKVLALVRAIDAMGNRRDVRVLILEHLGMRSTFGTYNAVFLSSVVQGEQKNLPGPAVAGLDVIPVDRDRWTRIQNLLEPLMRVGGGNNGVMGGWDGEDVTVISYFDGTRWQVEMWVGFGLRAEDWGRPSGVSAHVQTFYELLYYINTKLDGKPHFDPNELDMWYIIGDPEEQRQRERRLRGK